MPDHAAIGYSGEDPAEVLAMLDDLLHPERPWWHALAACRGQGPQPWFPDRGHTATAGLDACKRCDVRVECLQAAQEHEEQFGIWGGYSAKARRRLRRDAA